LYTDTVYIIANSRTSEVDVWWAAVNRPVRQECITQKTLPFGQLQTSSCAVRNQSSFEP